MIAFNLSSNNKDLEVGLLGSYDETQSSILNPSNLSSFFGSLNLLVNTLLLMESLLIYELR